MAAAAPSLAQDLRQVIESLLPEIVLAVHASFRQCHHRSTNDEADDICQQVIVLLMEDDFRRLRSFDHISSRRTWLCAVVKNHVINYLRRQRATISLSDLTACAIRCAAMEEERLIAREQRERLRAVLTRLTKRELELFELCFVAESSTAEIAEEMDIKLTSVRRRKHALVKKLQGFLDLPAH